MSKAFLFFKNPWIAGAGLVFMCCAVFAPLLDNSFIWDDDYYLTENLLLNNIDGLKRIWFDLLATPQYYPLVFTSFWIEHKFWSLEPLGYHVDNVILHCINTVLLWRILAFLRVKGSWLAAAIFAIHPVQVESVAWITERKNLLSGFFSFLSLYFFLKFYNPDKPHNFNEDQNEERPWSIYGVSLFFFICALWSKTVASTLPAVILLIYWWKQNSIRKKIFLLMVPYFTLGIVFSIITIRLEKFRVGAIGPEWEFSFLDRFLIAGRALWFYIGKLVWPNPIIFTYPRWNIDDSILPQYIYPFTFLFLIFFLWHWREKIGKGPLTAILFFAGSLFPALGFFNVYPMRYSFVADHFQYLSCIGIIVIFSSGVDTITGNKKSLASFILLAALLTTLGKLTWNQGPVYKNELSLWKDTVKKNPNAWIAHNNIGAILFAEGKNEEAISHYKMTIKLKPTHSKAYNNLGVALGAKGKTEEEIFHYKMAIKFKPDYAEAHYNLGVALGAEGKTEEEIFHYKMAIKLKPDFVLAHYNLGVALGAEGKIEEAISHYKMAIKINPDYANAHFNLGFALFSIKKNEEAISHFKMAIKIKPDYADAYFHLGNALVTEGKYEEAISDYKIAVKLKPDFGYTHYNLGLVLLQEGKMKEAVHHFRETLRLRPDLIAAQQYLESALLRLNDQNK